MEIQLDCNTHFNNFFLFQLLPLGSSTPNSSTSASILHELSVFYENSLDYLAQDFCRKSKIFSLKLLQDDFIQRYSTPLLTEFRSNLTDLIKNYPHYERFGLYEFLLNAFVDTTFQYYYQEPSEDSDVQYIIDFLHSDYDVICDEYEIRFENFITYKFLPLIEAKRSEIAHDKVKPIMHFVRKLKKCLNYECFYVNANSLIEIIKSPNDKLRELSKRFAILAAIMTNNIFSSVLKDEDLKELSADSKENIEKVLGEFIKEFELSNDIEKLIHLIPIFTEDYKDLLNVSGKDGQKLQKVIEKYAQKEFKAKGKQIQQLLNKIAKVRNSYHS